MLSRLISTPTLSFTMTPIVTVALDPDEFTSTESVSSMRGETTCVTSGGIVSCPLTSSVSDAIEPGLPLTSMPDAVNKTRPPTGAFNGMLTVPSRWCLSDLTGSSRRRVVDGCRPGALALHVDRYAGDAIRVRCMCGDAHVAARE